MLNQEIKKKKKTTSGHFQIPFRSTYSTTFTVSYEVTQSFITPAPLHVMDMPKFFNLEKCTVYCVVSTCSTTSQQEIHVLTAKNSGPGKNNTSSLKDSSRG